MPHRTLLDDLHGTPTVLLLGDEFDDPMKAACARLSAGPEPVDTYVLKVSFTKSPRTTVAEWGQYNEAPPERLVVLFASEGDDKPLSGTYPEYVTVDYVDPGDLTGLGIEVQSYLGEFQRADPDAHVVVCFDSLSPLLMYVDERVAFRFVRVLTGYFLAAGANVHYHLDPDAHDPHVRKIFESAVESTVEVTDDGDYDVRTR